MSDKVEKQGKNSEVGYCKPPRDKRFKPGVSGNPKGRPPGRSVTARLREMLDAAGDKKDLSVRMAETAYRMAMRGDFRFWNAIVERLDGKVADKIDLGGDVTVFHVTIPGEKDASH